MSRIHISWFRSLKSFVTYIFFPINNILIIYIKLQFFYFFLNSKHNLIFEFDKGTVNYEWRLPRENVLEWPAAAG